MARKPITDLLFFLIGFLAITFVLNMLSIEISYQLKVVICGKYINQNKITKI